MVWNEPNPWIGHVDYPAQYEPLFNASAGRSCRRGAFGGRPPTTLAHIEDFATRATWTAHRPARAPRLCLLALLPAANRSDAAGLSGATPTVSCGRAARERASRRHGRRWVHRRFHSCSPSSTLACRADRAPARQARTRTQPTRRVRRPRDHTAIPGGDLIGTAKAESEAPVDVASWWTF